MNIIEKLVLFCLFAFLTIMAGIFMFANHLVIVRPITESRHPNTELEKIGKEIEDSKIKIQKLRNDPEYKKMKKKYNLQDVPGIDTDFGKKVDLDDFLKNTQKQIKKSRSK